ncbi:hypothetical protein [Mycobacterium sp.]|uniref:hypothetical protein n=1 Tax=Mycobacterium sp. TaxID=1785 RepID=UPI002CE94D22|nr:hypothetical protein [Mycobacterium sp.]HKP44140.1 hypothetical protein [Mycobacterium sp.]
MADPSIVVHGTGGLALGLIGRQLGLGNCPFTLVGRLGDDSRRRQITESLNMHRLYLSGEHPDRATTIEVPDMIVTSDPAGLNEYRSALRADGDVMYFHSLRSGQPWAASEVETAVRDRRRHDTRGVLFLIPCENSVSRSISQLKADLRGTGFAYVDTMVDRICPEPKCLPGSSYGVSGEIVYVDTERDFEWAAELETVDPAAHLSFDNICQHANIQIAVDIDATKIRKRWMMNGTQLAISILAVSIGFRDKHLSDYCAQFPLSLAALMGDFRTACELSGKNYSEGELAQAEAWYTERLIASLRSGDDGKGDTVRRILSKAHRESAGEMLRDIADKIGDPYGVLSNHLQDRVESLLIHEVMEVILGSLLDPQ